ncbi:AAA family ATPase [Rhizobium rhizogenes]|uniref:AAA family ATPase n=1 Tax=Rhizobium rhizogenes TaxID=359 RepID=UPI0022C3B8AD|nr:AAA family ATPase [Rhizobium rhizogenes]MCZ7454367.1 AAA family ATPase [Rhizobium rhizogenes]
MRRVEDSIDLGRLFRSPQRYLAYRGLRQAFKTMARPGSLKAHDFVVLVIPKGYRPDDYESVSFELIGGSSDDWVRKNTKVRLANPRKGSGSASGPITVFELHGLSVLIAEDIAEVPRDVLFAAYDVIQIDFPSVEHIHAARRLAGRLAISEEDATLLSRQPQNVILAGIMKDRISRKDIIALSNLGVSLAEGSKLFELPGYHDAKSWARGLLLDIARWKNGTLQWTEIGKGALVSGPPGTGKTIFGAALANALGLDLISATIGAWQSAGALDEMLARMRRCFEDAGRRNGCILFIDEMEAIGRRGGRSGDRTNHYWHVVVAEFLSQLSDLGEGVIVVGATNHPELIDAAILRAGRMERHFPLSLPDAGTRAEILAYHTGHVFHPESLNALAVELDGKSGAQLEEIARNARKLARDQGRRIEIADLEAHLPEKAEYSLEEQFRLAVHEAGHALIALNLGYATSATIEIKRTFDPSADAYLGGVTSYEMAPDRLPTEKGLLNRIAVALSGMAAEAVVFAERSIGAGGTTGSDVERATTIARRMIGSYGFGRIPIFNARVECVCDEPLPAVLEEEVMDILKTQYDRVLRILTEERAKVISLAKDAVSHGVISIARESSSDAA